MHFTFHANVVSTEHPDGECFLVGFADENFSTEKYLLLQRAFSHDDQDVELGQDTYHVELCSQEQSGYGGISRFELHRDRIELDFLPEVSAELPDITGVTATFAIAEQEFSSLEHSLRAIFRDCDCLAVGGRL